MYVGVQLPHLIQKWCVWVFLAIVLFGSEGAWSFHFGHGTGLLFAGFLGDGWLFPSSFIIVFRLMWAIFDHMILGFQLKRPQQDCDLVVLLCLEENDFEFNEFMFWARSIICAWVRPIKVGFLLSLVAWQVPTYCYGIECCSYHFLSCIYWWRLVCWKQIDYLGLTWAIRVWFEDKIQLQL